MDVRLPGFGGSGWYVLCTTMYARQRTLIINFVGSYAKNWFSFSPYLRSVPLAAAIQEPLMAALPDPGPEENLPVDPDKRNGGCGVIFDDKLYMWGGETLDVLLPDDDLELEEGEEPLEAVEVIENLPRPDDPKHPFDVLDLSRMAWSRQSTSAKHPGEEDDEIPPEEIPAVGLGSSFLLDPEAECFLLFSGYNDLQFDAKVYRIFPGEWKWDILEPATDVKPTPRYLTGAIIHNNRLCTFGGVSVPIRNGKVCAKKGGRRCS